MRSIIRQNADQPALPDLRNLGTILRILLAVNGGCGARARSCASRARPRCRPSGRAIDRLRRAASARSSSRCSGVAAPWLARLPYRDRRRVVAVLAVDRASASSFVADRSRWLREPAGVAAAPCSRSRSSRIAVLLVYFRLRARALSPAITEARLQALQARIRPHFLFNSINAVLSLMRSEPQRAEAALEDLADLFRVLMRDNRDLAPLADEVELCRQYLDLEQLRLGDRLDRRLERQEHAGRRAGAAAGAAAAARERRLSRHRAVEPSRARSRSTSSCRAAKCTRSCKQPVPRRRRPPSRRQQDGARQHPRAPRAAFRRRGEPRVARDDATATRCTSACRIARETPAAAGDAAHTRERAPRAATTATARARAAARADPLRHADARSAHG